jgi:hypothetical protein
MKKGCINRRIADVNSPTHEKLIDVVIPIYEQGRPMDVEHIRWMYAMLCELLPLPGVDPEVVIPLAILHDVGYVATDAGNPFEFELRRTHMKKGAEIAGSIMFAVGYEHDTLTKVCDLIAIHDDWAFGIHEPYRTNRELGLLNDLDFIWMATKVGFTALSYYLDKTPTELLPYITKNEKLTNRPFTCPETANLFNALISERRQEVNSNK